jgi:hypothetical protein
MSSPGVTRTHLSGDGGDSGHHQPPAAHNLSLKKNAKNSTLGLSQFAIRLQQAHDVESAVAIKPRPGTDRSRPGGSYNTTR